LAKNRNISCKQSVTENLSQKTHTQKTRQNGH